MRIGRSQLWIPALGVLGVLISCPKSIRAQLVNPSFEVATAMPSAPGMWHLLPGWNNAGSGSSSPDFFHLDGSLGGDLPETPIALVMPTEGRGLAGISAIRRMGPNQPLAREYLVMELSEPLIVGEEYTLSFDVTNGQWLPTSPAGLAINALGVALTMEQPVQMGSGILSFPPVFQFSDARYDSEWERISFTFEVTGPSNYMTIGVFEPDDHLEAEVVMGNNPQMAYYFFDHFHLRLATEEEETVAEPDPVEPDPKPEVEVQSVYVPSAFSPNGDGLNDVFKPEVGDLNLLRMDVYSRWGQRVATLDPRSPEWDGRDFDGLVLSPGLYIWRMEWHGARGKGGQSRQGAVTILQ